MGNVFFFTALPTRSASEALAVACCDTPASQHGEYGRARGVVRREIERREQRVALKAALAGVVLGCRLDLKRALEKYDEVLGVAVSVLGGRLLAGLHRFIQLRLQIRARDVCGKVCRTRRVTPAGRHVDASQSGTVVFAAVLLACDGLVVCVGVEAKEHYAAAPLAAAARPLPVHGDVELQVLSKQSAIELAGIFPDDYGVICDNLWAQFGGQEAKEDDQTTLDKEKIMTKKRILDSANFKKMQHFSAVTGHFVSKIFGADTLLADKLTPKT